jgi:asparagine synthase (glutamine-hydrolysing)
MSGFITIYNTDGEPVDEQLIHSLTHTLKFRGPDRQTVWVDGKIGMGHSLFQTTHEAKYERQPSTLDGHVWITCSARIDDRENLVNKLGIKKQLDINKTPDSDLILHAYRKWGEDCLNHIMGDFAFVIWDARIEKLFCARDQFGKRALYYAQKKQSLILCNNLYSVLKHPDITKTLSDKAIAGFLLHGDHNWMDKSITAFNDIKALPPAHKLILHNNKLEIKQYWTLPTGNPILRYKNNHEYIEHFLDIFKTVIKDKIRTNSVVISMSGGMDSTSIAAMLMQIKKDNTLTNLNIQAVTATYDRLVSCEEGHLAGLVAQNLDIPIHYVLGDDYPFLSSSAMTLRPLQIFTPNYSYDITKKIASLSRVALTGDGADNLFSPSHAILAFKEENPISVIKNIIYLYQRYQKLPGFGLKTMFKNVVKKTKNDSSYPSWLNPEFEKKLNLQEYWEECTLSHVPASNQRHPQTYRSLIAPDWNLEDSILNPDFTSAEMRDPYLDLRLVHFIFSLPLLPWFNNKHMLRTAMSEYLPKPIIDRPKTYLNNFLKNLLLEPKNQWVKKWETPYELSKYIQPQKLTSGEYLFSNMQTSFVDMRPIILDIWVKQLEHTNFEL